MDIPTNDDGVFEVVDGDGVVVGHGIVTGDTIDFAYTDGTQEAATVLDRASFGQRWADAGVKLTIRAAA